MTAEATVDGVMFPEPWGGHVHTPRQPVHNNGTEQHTAALMLTLMFNECSIFTQVHAKSENGFIVLLLRACVFVHLYIVECNVCQTGVYKGLQCPRQVYALIYSCSECTNTPLLSMRSAAFVVLLRGVCDDLTLALKSIIQSGDV